MAYRYVPFPKCVYSADGQMRTIMSEDERPDGWLDHPKDFAQARLDAEKAKADEAVKLTAAEEKRQIRAFLDKHNVDYPDKLGIAELRDLRDQLEAHLAAQTGHDTV